LEGLEEPGRGQHRLEVVQGELEVEQPGAEVAQAQLLEGDDDRPQDRQDDHDQHHDQGRREQGDPGPGLLLGQGPPRPTAPGPLAPALPAAGLAARARPSASGRRFYSMDWAISSTSAWACLAAASGVSCPSSMSASALGIGCSAARAPTILPWPCWKPQRLMVSVLLVRASSTSGEYSSDSGALESTPTSILLQASVYSWGLSLVPERVGNRPSGVMASQST